VLPDWYLTRPSTPSDADLDDFAQLYERSVHGGCSGEIGYEIGAPKWQFLCWLTDTHDVLLHGSARDGVDEFEPRLPGDTSEFGNREAVFAASDGLWAMFFAILDRTIARSLVNACFTVRTGIEGVDPDDVYYYFSVNADALDRGRGFGPGVVYLLPRATFEQQADDDHEGAVIGSRQWASLVPVRPLGRLAVTPDDFPFLADVNGHDVETVIARAAADPDGFPWRG
jgi:hypothetical protein